MAEIRQTVPRNASRSVASMTECLHALWPSCPKNRQKDSELLANLVNYTSAMVDQL